MNSKSNTHGRNLSNQLKGEIAESQKATSDKVLSSTTIPNGNSTPSEKDLVRAQPKTGAKAIDVFDVRSDIKLDKNKEIKKVNGKSKQVSVVSSRNAKNIQNQDQNTHDSAGNDSVDLAGNITKMEAILDAELSPDLT